jgi:hypothetical protein
VEGFREDLTSKDRAVAALELTVVTQQLLIEELRGHNPESVSESTASPRWQRIDRIFAGRMLGGPKEERRPETPEGLSPTPAP